MAFYAVLKGRDGAKIYSSWDAAKAATDKFKGATHRKCGSMDEAEAWIADKDYTGAGMGVDGDSQ